MNKTDAAPGPETSTQKENRRTSRLPFTLPIDVEWRNPGGPQLTRRSSSQNVGLHGALLTMNNNVHLMTCEDPPNCRCGRTAGRDVPVLDITISLTNPFSKTAAQARVVRVDQIANQKLPSIAIEMLAPNETFWGLTFQLQRTVMRLHSIQRAFQGRGADIDFRVLRNLRDAVGYLWITSSSAQRWEEMRARAQNPYPVLDEASGQRVHHVVHLLNEVAMDIDAAELTSETQEFTNLTAAVDRLYDRITRGPAMAHALEMSDAKP